MATISITRDNTGQLVGLGEKNAKAYAKCRQQIKDLEPGEVYCLSVWFSRNPKLHGLHMAMLAQVFDQQEQFDDFEQFRMWAQVGAGHCVFVPGPGGKMCAIPKSIAWAKLDDADFQAHHEAVKAFLRSLRATRFLWPDLDDVAAGEAMAAILDGFER